MKPKQSLFFVVMLALLLPSNAPAFVEGKIEGVVKDSEGNPVPKVTVTIVSSKMASRRFQVSTNKDGKFTQIGVWPGYYQVSFSKSGYAPQTREVRVSISESTRMDIVLEKVQEAAEKSMSAADKLFVRGSNFYEGGLYAEAVGAFQEAIALNQTQWGYFFNLGLAFKKMENREASIEAFQKALELNPDSYSCNSELGEAMAKNGDYEKAKAHYTQASELSPDDPDAAYNLGVVHTNLGQSDEALQNFLKAVSLKDDFADAYYQIGTILVGKGMNEEAVKNLEKFLSLAPDHANAPVAKQLLDFLKK